MTSKVNRLSSCATKIRGGGRASVVDRANSLLLSILLLCGRWASCAQRQGEWAQARVVNGLTVPNLEPRNGKRNLDLRGDTKGAYAQLAEAHGIEVAFDSDLTVRNRFVLRSNRKEASRRRRSGLPQPKEPPNRPLGLVPLRTAGFPLAPILSAGWVRSGG